MCLSSTGDREDYHGAGAGVGVGGVGDHDALWAGEGGSDKRDWLLQRPREHVSVAWVLICRLIQPVGLEHDQGPGGRAQGVCVCVYTGVCVDWGVSLGLSGAYKYSSGGCRWQLRDVFLARERAEESCHRTG